MTRFLVGDAFGADGFDAEPGWAGVSTALFAGEGPMLG